MGFDRFSSTGTTGKVAIATLAAVIVCVIVGVVALNGGGEGSDLTSGQESSSKLEDVVDEPSPTATTESMPTSPVQTTRSTKRSEATTKRSTSSTDSATSTTEPTTTATVRETTVSTTSPEPTSTPTVAPATNAQAAPQTLDAPVVTAFPASLSYNTELFVRWPTVPGADSYEVYLSNAGTRSGIETTSFVTQSFDVSGRSGTFCAHVVARANDGRVSPESQFCFDHTFSVRNDPLAEAQLTSSIENGVLRYSWPAIPNATSYEVHVGSSNAASALSTESRTASGISTESGSFEVGSEPGRYCVSVWAFADDFPSSSTHSCVEIE